MKVATKPSATREELPIDLESTRIVQRLRDGTDLSSQYLEVWREFLRAKYGHGIQNGRDGHVIEIWVHQLIPEGLGTAPLFPELPMKAQAWMAAVELSKMLRRYRELYPGDAIRLGGDLHDLRRFSGNSEGVVSFTHRIYVEIRPAQVKHVTAGSSSVPWWRSAWRACVGRAP